ncbi:MAG TPA: hypothetical protein PK037_07595 [Saprospiraceae bacterium]|nr:hypothetical protein [Saprospiraceae bacterium]
MKNAKSMQTSTLAMVGFTLLFTVSVYGQLNFNDDFESYASGTNIQTIENWKTADLMYISDARARSGSQSLKVANPNSSLAALLRYDEFTTGKIEFEFYLWKEKKASITISPNYSFPNVKFKITNIVSSYINEESGFLTFEAEKWHKVNIIYDADLRYYDFKVDDVVINRGIYTSFFRNAFAINNYPAGEVYVDDFKVKQFDLPTPKNNLLITGYRLHQLNLQNTTDSLFISVSQAGSQMLEGLEVKWSQNGVEHTQEFPDFSLSSGGQENIFLGTVSLVEGINHFSFYIESKNNAESDYTDNHLELVAEGRRKGNKPLLLEYTTSTSHSFSPAAIYSAEKILNQYQDDVTIINMHGNDPMYAPAYYFAGPFAIPRMYANRTDTNVLPAVDELMPLFQSDSPIDLDFSIVYDEAKQQLKCQTDVTFLSDYENPLYHTVVLVEDSVTGTSSYYDQANFYSGGGYGNLGGFENKPPYIPASEMVYRFVGRKAFNGVYGSKVYVDMQAGQKTSYLATDEMSIESITDRHYLVSIVMDQNRRVMNHKKVKIKDVIKIVTASKDIAGSALGIYPNPASGSLFLSGWQEAQKLEIYNCHGVCVLNTTAYEQINIEHLPNELYYLNVVRKDGNHIVLPFIKAN